MEVPRVTVGALILDDEGNALLVRSHKWFGKYILPGGHVEFGERQADAVRREVLEETGLIVDDVEFIEVVEIIDSEGFWKPGKHFVGSNFLCRVRGGELKLNEEHEEHIWCTLQEALALDLVPVTRHTIETVLRRKSL